MFQADDQPGLEPEKDPRYNLISPRVEVRREIDLNAADLSPAFRKDGPLSLEELVEYFQERQTNTTVNEIVERLASGSISDQELLSKVTDTVIAQGTAKQQGLVLGAALSGDVTPARKLAAALIISSAEKRAEGDMFFRNEFTESLENAPPVILQRILSLGFGGDIDTQVADTFLSSKLKSVAQGLEDQELKERFTGPKLSDRERIAVLAHVTPEARLELLRDIVAVSINSDTAQSVLAEKMNNMLHYSSTDERTQIVKDLVPHASGEEGKAVGVIIGNVLRSSDSLKQLTEVVESVGVDQLKSLGDEITRNLVAQSQLAKEISQVEFPELLAEDATQEQVNKAIEGLKEGYGKILTAVVSSGFTDTMIARQYYAIGQNGIGVADFDKSSISDLAQLRQSTNENILTANFERDFGVNLVNTYEAYQTPDGQLIPGNHAKWSAKDIQTIREVFELLPETEARFTPLVHTLERRHDLTALGAPRGALGARYADGTIRIGSDAIDNEFFKNRMSGIDSLKVVLTHELGHSIQFGRETLDSKFDTREDFLKHLKGDARYDFGEFMALSNWEIVPPSSYSYAHAGQAVKFGDKAYPLNVPVNVEGEKKYFMRMGQHLMSYKPQAGFSLRQYARTSPNEDWSEAFAEYFLMPERLIQFAPDKFKFMEEEFRVYEDKKPELLEKMNKKLNEE